MTDHNDISQLCRLCLVKDKVNHSIFGESGDFGGLLRKINSCLPVSISKNDGLPKRICDACSTKLDLFYQFRNDSIKAEQQLLQWFHKNNTINNEEDLIKMNTAEIKEEIIEIQDNKTDTVGYNIKEIVYPTSTSKDELPTKRPKRTSAMKALEHMESEDDDDDFDEGADDYGKDDTDDSDKEGSYQEGPSTSVNDQPGPSGMGKGSSQAPFLPDEMFIPIVQLKEVDGKQQTKKKKTMNKGKIRVKPEFRLKAESGNNESMEMFECPICKDDVKRILKELKAHYKTDHQGKRLRTSVLTNQVFPCDICGKELKHKSALKEHIETHNNSYSCDLCGINHKKPVDHVIHMRSHSEQEGSFRCIFCDFSTSELVEIQSHMSGDHERTQKYHCNICNKGFQIFSWFVEHENFHTGVKPFGCEFCGKTFLYSRYLAAHRNSMHKEELTGIPNIHECVICKKQYQHKNSLNLHMNSHTGNFAICDICGKILSSKEKLKFHLRTHTGYKPFSCSYCGKCFTKKPILVEHVRIHTGERPYVCEYCTKCFSQRSSLVIHIRSHTGERPYVCQFCQRGFVAKAMLNIHLKSCKGIPIVN